MHPASRPTLTRSELAFNLINYCPWLIPSICRRARTMPRKLILQMYYTATWKGKIILHFYLTLKRPKWPSTVQSWRIEQVHHRAISYHNMLMYILTDVWHAWRDPAFYLAVMSVRPVFSIIQWLGFSQNLTTCRRGCGVDTACGSLVPFAIRLENISCVWSVEKSWLDTDGRHRQGCFQTLTDDAMKWWRWTAENDGDFRDDSLSVGSKAARGISGEQ